MPPVVPSERSSPTPGQQAPLSQSTRCPTTDGFFSRGHAQCYTIRFIGPLLDRIDIHVGVPQVKFREIAGDRPGETSAQIRGRVVAARRRQQERFAAKQNINCNAHIGPRELKEFCALAEQTKELLQFAMTDLRLSARAYDLILKVARTIADLADSEHITADHIGEAIQFRSLDRQIWG